jgi:acyl carrier protein
MELDVQVRNVMAKVLKIAPEQITDDTAPGTIKGWDSLRHMTLVTALEDEFDIEFDDEEFEQLVSFRIIVAVIQSYLED